MLRLLSQTSLEDFAGRLLSDRKAAGLSLSAFSGEAGIDLVAGLRNAGSGEPLTSDSVFPCASLSKPVAAFMALKLVESGNFDIDQPLARYLPEHPDLQARELQSITTRQVLSHRSGLPNWRRAGEALGLRGAADTRFKYSGEGYLLAQRVMEAVSGLPFERLAVELVFEPFGMTDSGFIWRDTWQSLVVSGHDQYLTPSPAPVFPQPNAAYTLFGTPRDYLSFIRGLHTVGAILEQMRTPEIALEPDLAWGLGWSLGESTMGPCLWHIGDLIHFVSLALSFPEADAGLVIMTNSQNGRAVCEALAKHLFGEALPVENWIAGFFRTFDRAPG